MARKGGLPAAPDLYQTLHHAAPPALQDWMEDHLVAIGAKGYDGGESWPADFDWTEVDVSEPGYFDTTPENV